MKVLLIAPPTYRFSSHRPYSFHLGLGHVAATVRARGHDVAIYDANLPVDPRREASGVGSVNEELEAAVRNDAHPVWQEVAAVVRERAPDVVGVSVKILDMPSAWKVAEIAKAVAPSCVTVLGGPLATTSPDIVMSNRAVDYVIRREGELTMPALLDILASGSTARAGVEGLSYREGDRAVHAPDRALIRDLDALPPPAKELLLYVERQPEEVRHRIMGDVVTSRGCPHGCTFCANQAVWGTRKVRMRSPASIVAELEDLTRRYGVRRFTIWDDQLTAHRKRAVELCERLIAAKLGVKWLAFAHPNTVDRELLELMKAAGCDEIQLGIESGTDRILKLVRKGSNLVRIRRAAQAVRDAGLRWHAFFMVGFPTETREEMEQTLQLMYELRPNTAQLSVVTPYPGTDLFRESEFSSVDGEWLHVDKFNAESLLVDTMPHEEFSVLAREFQEKVVGYNAGLPSTLPKRMAVWGLHAARWAVTRVAGKPTADRLAALGRRFMPRA
jgi:radical SAM superfamily enzyme YgiQ (UPF0313 family)